ncbi:MAG: membrane protein insertion efficiency factor YidD [Actinomycetota bacterium]
MDEAGRSLRVFGPSAGAVALIRLYQRATPARVRAACRFTPTCSEYAIRSIEKYGLLEGAARGLRRIHRCRPPNGGTDEP